MLEKMTDLFVAHKTESGKSVAIVGSGPAGLSAAYYLRKAGHSVAVFEERAEAGGMLLYSIPSCRLPKDVVRKQLQALCNMGIVLKVAVQPASMFIVDVLSKHFNAMLITAGAWKEKTHDLKGNGRIFSGIEFLKKVNMGDTSIPGKKVVIIGVGNVAIDVERALLRLHAEPVMMYRRGRKEMPAFKDELEKAVEEGIAFRFFTLPVEASEDQGKISLRCVRTRLGPVDASGRRVPIVKPDSDAVLFDASVLAIGEEPDWEVVPKELQKKPNEISSDHFLGHNIYMAGDFIEGPSTVIEAATSGRAAVNQIDPSLKRLQQTEENRRARFAISSFQSNERASGIDLPVTVRSDLGTRDIRGISRDEAEREAGRCFNCGCAAVNASDIGTALVALKGTIVTAKRSIDALNFLHHPQRRQLCLIRMSW